MPRDTQADAETVAQIEAAARAKDIPRAVEMARRALADGLVHPMLLNLRSFWWTQQGGDREALADLEKAVEIAPDDLLVRNAYGMLLGKHGRWAEALALFRGSVDLAPEFPLAQFGLGWALESTGELPEAAEHYERARILDPNFVEPLIRLSSLAYRRADQETARTLVNRALMMRPGDYVALTTLASVAIADGDFDQADGVIRRLIAAKPPTPLDGAFARTALGDLRHAQGRYAQAFTAYTAANREKFKLYAPQYDNPGATVTDYCRWLASYFATAPSAQWSAREQAAPDDPRDGATGHVFLVGFPRSGTTLLENVLAAHPGIATLEERDVLADATRTFLINEEGRDRLAVLSDEEIADWRERYWAKVREYGVDVGGKVFVDKYPLTTMKLPVIAKLFPKARILFAVRDPRDVVLSCFRRAFGMNSSMFEFLDIERAAKFYDAVMTLAAVYREHLGLEWREARHETLLADFETEARAICTFIGVDWNAAMTDFADHAKTRNIRTPSSTQVLRGLNRDGVAMWKNYEAEMTKPAVLLKPWLREFNYDD